jgi:hypothetical protein
MNRGVSTSKSRALSPDATVLDGQGGGQLVSLSCRFERLLKRIRFLASHCEQAPDPLRQDLKQFLDLAAIELEEGYQALVRYQGNVPQSVASSDSLPHPNASIQPAENPRVELASEVAVNVPLVVAEVQDCEQRIDSALDQIEMSFDAMAQLAEIPEAADLTAILAKLESGGDAVDSDEFDRPVKTSPSNTRERLLGFEVCRMEGRPNRTSSGIPAEPMGLLNKPAISAFESNGQPELAQFATLEESNPLVSTDAEPPAEPPAEAELPHAIPAASPAPVSFLFESQFAPEATAEPEPVLETSAPESNPGEEHRSGSSSPKARASEQSENANPLDSIAPDNLQAILSLKEELIQVSAKFKKS